MVKTRKMLLKLSDPLTWPKLAYLAHFDLKPKTYLKKEKK